MIGIIPFLIQWVALSLVGQQSNNYFNPIQQSHWTLLTEFTAIPEDEIELFLPQVCNILLDRDNQERDEYGLYQQFERILLDKCARCFPFGIRVCNLLKAASLGPSEGTIIES